MTILHTKMRKKNCSAFPPIYDAIKSNADNVGTSEEWYDMEKVLACNNFNIYYYVMEGNFKQ